MTADYSDSVSHSKPTCPCPQPYVLTVTIETCSEGTPQHEWAVDLDVFGRPAWLRCSRCKTSWRVSGNAVPP